MFTHFFIDRPILSTVLSVLIVLAGAVSLSALSIEQYPEMAPPEVTVDAIYPGAHADAAAGRGAAGPDRRQEHARHHDGRFGVLARRALRRGVHRQLLQPLRAGGAEAPAGRQPLAGVRLAGHRHAHLAAPRSHGAA